MHCKMWTGEQISNNAFTEDCELSGTVEQAHLVSWQSVMKDD